MNKKLLIVGASALCVVSIAVGALASTVITKIEAELRPDFTIEVDGKEQVFKDAQGNIVYPILYDGTTYLPVRAVGELMGKTVYWYEGEKRIDLKTESTTVTDADVIVPSSPSATPAATPASGEISLDEAKSIALEKAGLSESEVVFLKAYLDADDKHREYDIEFYKDNTEYSAEISAADGRILSWDVDTEYRKNQQDNSQNGDIGLDRAKEIALEKADLNASDVVFKKAEIDYDDGIRQYDIEFMHGRTEYSAEIKASDGTILSWEIDKD